MSEPSHLLVKHLSQLPPQGKVLDVAMGRGRNAIYLASHGFRVVGLERDGESISVCQQEAQKNNLEIEVRRVDLEDLESLNLEKSAYDVVICFNYLQRSLMPLIRKAVRPGGFIIYETFLIDQHILTGHPKHREYCFEHNELLQYFIDFRIMYYFEGQNNKGTYKAGLVAQKAIS